MTPKTQSVYYFHMATVTVNKRNIQKQKGIVILPIAEYRRLIKRSVPTYYLTGKEAENVDKLVNEGLREYKAGKTIEARSLTDALKIYERKRKH